MEKLRRLFTGTAMGWMRVILFAVISAAVTAFFLILPVFKGTSFEYMGVYPESWLLFALLIIMNCKKPLEAGAKTFVFFLISQPLIYLLQVPFSFDGWQIFQYYPRWFIITLLCFPGGIIAWYVKKDNFLSSVILSVACALSGALLGNFLKSWMHPFPRLLLTVLLCAFLSFVIPPVLLNKKSNCILPWVVAALCAVGGFLRLIPGF